jgi:FtsP/CotA-like multicopper oxidase with cupredoxin domain
VVATYSSQPSAISISEGGLLVTTVTTTDVLPGSIIYYGVDTTAPGSISGADLATGSLMGQTTVRSDGTAEIRQQLFEDYVPGEMEHIKINLYSDKPYGTLVHEGQYITIQDTSKVVVIATEVYQPASTPFSIIKWATPVTVPSLKLPEYVGNGAGPWALDPSLFPSAAPALYQDVDPAQKFYGGIANEFFDYNISSGNRTTPYFDNDDPVAWYSQYELGGEQVLYQRADGVEQKTPIYGYDGTYPGTTFKTKVGAPIVVRHHNQLPGYDGINPANFPERESIHLHGGHNPSHSDGYSSYVVNPGMYRDYYYTNTVPNGEDGQPDFSESPSTMWYHDHGEDLTDLHVILGMSGFWYSFDEYELGLVRDMKLPGWSNKDENGNLVEWDADQFMQTNSKYDIALAISDRTFNADGTFFYDGSPVGNNIDGYLGDVQLVNGVAYPFLVVEPTQTRLRMLGAATGRFYQLSIQDKNGVKQDHLRIGNDTWLMGEAIEMDEFTLSMAQRADVVMDFSQYAPGTELFLVNTAEQHSGRGPVGKLNELGTTGFSERIMKIVVGESSAATPTYSIQVGDELRAHNVITQDQIARTRQFEFGRRGGMWVVNQQGWEYNRVDNAITLGNAEQWNLINGSGGWWHPIHIHLESHQVLTIEGKAPSPNYWPEKQWKSDTTILGPNTTAEIAMNFRTFEGGFVFHCHNLNHEDSMMMYNFWTQLYDGFFQEGAIVKDEYDSTPDYFPLMHDPAHVPGINDGPTNSIDPITGINYSTSADIAVGTIPHTTAAGHVDAGGVSLHDPAAGSATGHEGHLGHDVSIPTAPTNLSVDIMAAFGTMLWGGNDDDVITPSGDNNFWADTYIHGGAGNDVINGYYGNDVLVGGTGDDYIDGGAGMDMAIYGTKASDLAFDLVGGELQVSSLVDGTDILRSVEMLLAQDGMFHFAPGATDGDDELSYQGKSRVVLFGGKGSDTLKGGNWDDIFYINAEGDQESNAVNGRDFIDGNGWATSGDLAIIQGDALTETYRIYSVKPSDHHNVNASYRDVLSSIFGEFNAATEAVVFRSASEVSVDELINDTSFQVIAEIANVQEYLIKLSSSCNPNTTQKVQIFGDFDSTSLSITKGFVIESDTATVIDVTNLISAHSVTLKASQPTENTIVGIRPQDKIVAPTCESDYCCDDGHGDAHVHAKGYTEGCEETASADAADPHMHTHEADAHVHTDACTEACEESSITDAPADVVGKALHLGLSLNKLPNFISDLSNDLVLRPFGTSLEQGSKFYLALTAESLRDASIDTLDVTLDLGADFFEVFQISGQQIFFSEDLAVQRQVRIDGTKVRFEGAGLNALGEGLGKGVDSKAPIAVIALTLRDDINDQIQGARVADRYGFLNSEAWQKSLNFEVSANIDQVVFSDLVSLRDLGGDDALLSDELHVMARAAQAELSTDSSFGLGTERSVLKPGETGFTNLIRSGDTLERTTQWQNDGEFSFRDLTITNLDQAGVAEAVSVFLGDDAITLNTLTPGTGPGTGEVAEIRTTFMVTGEAGSVLDTKELGFQLDALGGYRWDTSKMDLFQQKNLVTFQGDLNYDGAVTMKDLAFLNAGAARGVGGARGYSRDVDANFDGELDIEDLAILDADWGRSLHQGDDKFLGSDQLSMASLSDQGPLNWDSSAFQAQNTIEAKPSYSNPITDSVGTLVDVQGFKDLEALIQEQQQQYGLN